MGKAAAKCVGGDFERRACEFRLLRYVPDAVRNEFVHIGVILREQTRTASAQRPGPARPEPITIRFTRDWRRVRCIDPAADTELLESLEEEIAALLLSDASGPAPPKPTRWPAARPPRWRRRP